MALTRTARTRTERTRTAPAAGRRQVVSPTLMLNIVAPIVAYYALHAFGVGDVVALSLSAVFPVVATAVTIARTRRVDALGVISAVFIVSGVVVAALVQDPRALLVANALPGMAVGLVFLGSLLTARPMIARIVRQMAESGTPDLWDTNDSYRAHSRRITLIWGVAITAAGLLHIAVALFVAPELALIVSLLVTVATLGPVALWTVRMVARSRTT